MSFPKKRNIDLTPPLVGQARIEQLISDIDPITNYFPSGILIKDLESGVRDFVRELNFTIDSERVPVIFFPGERWSEFSKSWKYLDKDKNIIFPIITVRRLGPPKPGSHTITKYVIPGRKTFTYLRVPTFDGQYHGVNLYKIPQPVPVDLIFSVQVFTHYIQDLNKFNELMLIDFSSRQSYSKVKGRFIPLVLDDISDESTMESFDQDRFYSQSYSLTMLGYLQDESEFEIANGVKKIIMFTEVSGDYPIISGSTVSGGT